MRIEDNIELVLPIAQIASSVIGWRFMAYDLRDEISFKNLCIRDTMAVQSPEDEILPYKSSYGREVSIRKHRSYRIGLSIEDSLRIKSISRLCITQLKLRSNHTKTYKEEEEMVGRRINSKVNKRIDVVNDRINSKLDMVLSRMERKLVSKIKTHFGIEFIIYTDNDQQKAQFNAWLRKYDKKFFDHILDPEKMDNTKRVITSGIVEEFIVKLDRGTYLYVRPSDINNSNMTYTPVKRRSDDVYVYIFGKKCMKYGKELSKFLEEHVLANDIGMLYTVSARSENNWSCVCQDINMRSFDNLFFESEVEDAIKNHLDNWKNNESVYLDRDILFKTGILLYGNAGTGKSSMATAIAKYMNCNIITVDLNTFNALDISSFVSAINADKTRYVVLLDEIDTIFTSRENEDSTETQTANTMKLLSLLDSPQSPNNVIFVATTNYIDRLDNALTRKGRFDLKLRLGNLTREPAERMCKSFNLNERQTDIVLSRAVKNDKYNPAVLQDCILKRH